MTHLLLFLLAATCPAPHPAPQGVSTRDSLELVRLERVWNEAHLRADTTALDGLWADDIVITVPGMPVMSKVDALRFWRTGRSNIVRYETSGLRVRVYDCSAVVTGEVDRERNFDGQTVRDTWRFIKVYTRQSGSWRVVAYQATVAHL
jgi:hypothetical protein